MVAAILHLQEGAGLAFELLDHLGGGFPRRRGGPMFFADEIGLATVLAGIEKYGKRLHAEDWQPAPLLKKLAESGSTFAARHAARSGG